MDGDIISGNSEAKQDIPEDGINANTSVVVPEGHASGAKSEEMERALEVLAGALGGKVDEKRLAEIEAEIEALKGRLEMVTRFEAEDESGSVKISEELVHSRFEMIATFLANHVNVWLVGPAGSGKTTLARQCAKAIDGEDGKSLPFAFTGALHQEYKLMGFINANGTYVRTAFRDIFEFGGLFLFDEADASAPQVLTTFNSIIANHDGDFPDQNVTKHADCRFIAAANTFGAGADMVYVSRNQQDGATLDRFAFLELPYDEKLEWIACGFDPADEDFAGFRFKGQNSEDDCKSYVRDVRKWRAAADSLSVRHVIGPRASLMGIKMLRAGVSRRVVEKAFVWKGLAKDTVKKIKQHNDGE